jgi:hypothetical protein
VAEWAACGWSVQILIDTIAMIGSPASRGAVASVVGTGRACPAAASAVSGASAAIAASVTMAGAPQRRVASGLRRHESIFQRDAPVERPARAPIKIVDHFI